MTPCLNEKKHEGKPLRSLRRAERRVGLEFTARQAAETVERTIFEGAMLENETLQK